MPVVPARRASRPLNLDAIHGGLAEGRDGMPSPLVADSCRMVLDRRFLIEEDLAEVKAEVSDSSSSCATTGRASAIASATSWRSCPT